MKIVVTFDTLEEFEKFRQARETTPEEAPKKHRAIVPDPRTLDWNQEPQEAPQGEETPATTPSTTETETPTPAPAEPTETPPWEEKPTETVDESYRIKVRKQLAELNRAKGFNRAVELIQELTGEKKLTEAALEDLPRLMAKAKEETNAK